MRKIATIFAALAIAALPGTAFAQSSDGMVTVVHGVPGLVVDVYVDGALTLEDFEFETVAGPLTLPAADYEIEIYAADADPATTDPALASTVTLPAGADASIVAHLTEAGDPTLSVFVNDISTTDAGNGRVTARHTAAAPTVDILANDGVLFGGVSNPAEGVADVPADTYNVKIVPTGTTTPVVFETDLAIPEGTNVIVYAIGDLGAGTFTVAAQTISGLHTAPAAVSTGTGGLAADGGAPFLAIAALVAGAVALGGGAVVFSRSR